MLEATEFAVDTELITQCSNLVHSFTEFKTAINCPTGNFFYDPWTVKEEYHGTAFEAVLNKLPFDIGEARIIALSPMNCYTQHADIDDRYHLNIAGDGGYLLDLVDYKIYPTDNDGKWYVMDTGKLHTAVSCGEKTRYQLVVRKLLKNVILDDFKIVTVKPLCNNPRFKFDNLISPWLNYANKKHIISSFEVMREGVRFKLKSNYIDDLKYIDRKLFNITVE